ncbi:nucleotidyltransferase domain-containing protein [Phototrophicus methaneseepsis]|uniref:Nucleotidyltransferase domain-containing protein n=1 Tax=Phototrophicus methaneseepsis TaxID=2710758 RepID=A0A7S8EBC4_9CHLR|nr:nucleotidyltransferase domain-containing protein [Phototrophicus methaneseepsis]QPC83811.1 nucleotidyltransferase domain-containing protein [Phototrophicus methaneseepsis]
MYAHHQESLERIARYFSDDPAVQALMLTGSIAHGFAKENSDVDIAIVVTDEDYAQRTAESRLTFYNPDLCTYEGGYADGKIVSVGFMQHVAESGSDPARFAFADAKIVFSKIDNLEQLLSEITRYPVEEKTNRIQRFYAQFEGWHWFTTEAHKHNNRYLLNTAVSKLVLFGGRMILAHNEQLYPYHKWFLRVLEHVPAKPENLMARIDTALQDPSQANINAFFDTVNEFRDWEKPPTGWPNQFLQDSEITWMHGESPIDDL